ncbi:bacteriocin-like protein [Chryseobacterium joostei]
MKNLKKLSREATKQIKGSGPRRCTENYECIYGACCKGVCMEYACMED